MLKPLRVPESPWTLTRSMLTTLCPPFLSPFLPLSPAAPTRPLRPPPPPALREVRSALRLAPSELSDGELDKLFRALDVGKLNRIYLSDFIRLFETRTTSLIVF